MNAREKEQYLREYEILKKQGKPFFPYAVFKDSAMAVITLGVIIVDGDRARRRARPEGRPDEHDLRPAARVVLLLPVRAAARREAAGARLPGHDRHPDDLPGPAARCCRSSTAARSATRPSGRSRRSPGITTIGAMAYLSILGATAGSPTEIEMEVAPQYEEGRAVAASSGCLACHAFKENGNHGPGPRAVRDRRAPAGAGDRAHAREPDGADAVVRVAAREPAGEVQ